MNDISVPASIIFIDSLGATLPFKQVFSYQELQDFTHRDGISTLAGREISEDDLGKIAYLIHGISNRHITIEAEPTNGNGRSPLSKIDLQMAGKRGCRKCGATVQGTMLCDDCRSIVGKKKAPEHDATPKCTRCELRPADHDGICQVCAGIPTPARRGPNKKGSIQLYANVTLHDGTSVHVVEITGEQYIGVDNTFVAHEFRADEIHAYVNLEEPLIKLAACNMCGEPTAGDCSNCGAVDAA